MSADRLPALSLAIVGADYPNKRGPGRRFEIALCAPGEPLEIRAEPESPADEHAVAVYSERGVQIGYLPSERAVRIAQILRQGRTVTAIFQQATAFGAVARLAFNGELPVLPTPRPRSIAPDYYPDTDHDFYPDEIWPDN